MDAQTSGLSKEPYVSTEGERHAPTYIGDRTEGTRNAATRVRRLFNFAQIFFFELSYMSSWEAVSDHVLLVCAIISERDTDIQIV
jgi:hypothetical protein